MMYLSILRCVSGRINTRIGLSGLLIIKRSNFGSPKICDDEDPLRVYGYVRRRSARNTELGVVVAQYLMGRRERHFT